MWKGSFDMGGKLPKLNKNVIPIVGFVEDTLDQFLNEHSPKINFVHLDMDLYKPTKFTLEKIKPYLVNGAIILFDEIYNFPNWEYGEYKALTEVFDKESYKFRIFNLRNSQACIEVNIKDK